MDNNQWRTLQEAIANQLRIIHKRIDSLPHSHAGIGGSTWGVTFEYDNSIMYQCTVTATLTKNNNLATNHLVWYYYSTSLDGLSTPIPAMTDVNGQFVSTIGDDAGEPIYLFVFDPNGERHLSDPITFN